MILANKAVDNRKNARDRNASASSVNVKNKAAVAARNVVAVSKAADKPGCIRLISGGRRLPPFLLDRFVASLRSG
jgi:hypothetical protein